MADRRLAACGRDTGRVMPLNEVDIDLLASGAEGPLHRQHVWRRRAPDGASLFAEHVMGAKAELSSLR